MKYNTGLKWVKDSLWENTSWKAEALPGDLQTSSMETFATIVYGFQPLAIVTKLSMLDVC